MLNKVLEGDPIVCGLVALVTILLAAAIHSFISEGKTSTSRSAVSKTDAFDIDGDWADEGTQDVKKTLKEKVEEAPTLVMDNPTKPAGGVPPVKPKVNKGPFKIGERIVVSSGDLKGRHGVIADVWDGKSYPVDLDLPVISNDKVSDQQQQTIKVDILKKEGDALADLPTRADVHQGCLDETTGRIAIFMLKTLRSVTDGICTNQLKLKEKSPLHSWQYWEKVYPPYLEFLSRGILMKAKLSDLEQSIHPQNPKGTYKRVVEAVKSPQAAKSWNCRIEGQFWLVGMGPEGTMVVPVNNIRQVYCVVGYQKPLGALLGQMPRPPKVQLTILPWYGRLIHDTLVSSTTGTNQMELASPPLTQQLAASCQAAISEGRVVFRLQQLEATDGSTEGVPFVKPIFKPPPAQPAPDFSKEPTATQEERSAVENMTELLSFHPKTPLAAWNCIRLPSQTDPSKTMLTIVQGQGQKLHEVELKQEYSALLVLKTVLSLATSKMNGKRPIMVGVDDPQVVNRMRFLCQGIKNFQTAFLKVERKAQAPPTGMGN